jgi:hypothetical protein
MINYDNPGDNFDEEMDVVDDFNCNEYVEDKEHYIDDSTVSKNKLPGKYRVRLLLHENADEEEDDFNNDANDDEYYKDLYKDNEDDDNFNIEQADDQADYHDYDDNDEDDNLADDDDNGKYFYTPPNKDKTTNTQILKNKI